MGTEKALLAWPPQAAGQPQSTDTFLSAAIRSLLASADFVVVVTGRNEHFLAPVVYANGAQIAVNPDPSRGQFSSLQIGLREVLNRGRDAAMITLVDRPPASADTVATLRAAFESASTDTWAVVTEFEGKHGHPYVVGREMMEEFLLAPPTGSARDIEHRYRQHIRYISVSDPAVAMNINTPEEYAALGMRADLGLEI